MTSVPRPPPLLAIGLLLVVVVAITGIQALDKPSEFVKGKICIGTNGRMSVPSNREHHYRSLRDRYSNCTYVDGNLELTWLQDPNLDLSFLQYIREVTGYVLISHVDVKRTILPRLQIIRGRTLFKLNVRKEEFALMVTLSKMHNLELPALRDILAGSVGIFSNYNLCHIKTINWDEIITDPDAKHVYVYNFTSPERECPPCDSSCAQGCWGEGPHNCQQFSKVNCSPQCYKGRCFGPKPRECCHLFCAGGCKGPKQSDCIACRNFYDDGVCTHECPPMQMYNSITYSWETNPNGKYAYGATCVKNCPEHLLKDNGACVRSCPPKKKALNGECVPCDGPCPKTCKGVATVHSGNIDSFKDCTIIEGSISILDTSFNGFQQVYANFSFGPRYGRMHPDKLEVFSTLKEVTGYINIQGQDPAFTNLSYFRNLEVIGGRTLTEFFSSLYIVKTSLNSLGLRSLQKVHSGSISIVENQHLCYVNEINWKRIKKSNEHNVLINNNSPKENCTADGHVCHEECSSEGCWGPGPDQCLSCAHFRLGITCLKSCDSVHGMYEAAAGVCKPCHDECADTCTGAGPDNCTACKHVRDGPYCVSQCPQSKFNHDGQCKPCHDHCLDGCSGPSEYEGPNGCHTCKKGIMLNQTVRCIAANEPCPKGYFYERFISPNMQDNPRGTGNCRLCHPRCLKCTGYGFHESHCQECRDFKRGEQCEDECPRDFYVVSGTKDCLPCESECRSCYGPTESQCTACRNYKLFLNGGPGDNSTAFNCTASCPTEAPHKIFPQDNSDPYCSEQPLQHALRAESPKTTVIIGAVIAIAISLILLVGAIGWLYHQKTKAKHSAAKMALALTGVEDEPLRPTNVKPNLTQLRIVKEAEMRKGGVLGYGAFGTVYKGVWVPEGENVKIPVAIKVLREGTGANTSKEFKDEALIMATVEHPNLLQLLGVCMGTQMMLVTQLMPLGCLLDYVRNFKDKIGCKPLLNWCTQIAKGMAYLEGKSIVHRDLAARNVLVQTPNCVKITDFGLAKLLDINEDEYKAAGGKMPIKWLALECIQHRIFNHKSDVWAFGVTVWELLTYGARPYENVPARDVPELLEKGERLYQPSICTIEVYLLMIQCWMLDADARPSFKELSDEFAKMARDPGRYLVIDRDRHSRPAYTAQDEKDLIRNLSSTLDGPEALVDADEYLQPKSRAPMFGPAPSPSPPPPNSLGNCSNSQQQPPAPWTDLGYPNCVSIQGMGSGSSGGDTIQTTTSTANDPGISVSRYCSDPLKMLSARDCLNEEECVDGTSQSNRAQVGSLKLELPLDEDDYLMPSPQPHGLNSGAAATTYMDLIGDSKDSTNGFTYPDFLPNNTCVDNPEYHIMNTDPSNSGLPGVILSNGLPSVDNIPECSNAGLPIMTNVPNCVNVNETNGATTQNQNIITAGIATTNTNSDPSGTQTRPYVTHQRSSEEESDHEYYNDLDRLQRELQPLKPFRRNETTV